MSMVPVSLAEPPAKRLFIAACMKASLESMHSGILAGASLTRSSASCMHSGLARSVRSADCGAAPVPPASLRICSARGWHPPTGVCVASIAPVQRV
eukprot:3934023-Rhodomonas_salina.2